MDPNHSDDNDSENEITKIYKRITNKNWVGKSKDENERNANPNNIGGSFKKIETSPQKLFKPIKCNECAPVVTPKNTSPNNPVSQNTPALQNTPVSPNFNTKPRKSSIDPNAVKTIQETSKITILNPNYELYNCANNLVKVNQLETVDELINDFQSTQYYSDMEQRARLIYSWICFNDLETLDFPERESNSDEEIMWNIRMDDNSYSKLFNFLTNKCKIHCENIIGQSTDIKKLDDLKDFEHYNFRSLWNAIYLNNQWQLVDCFQAKQILMNTGLSIDEIIINTTDFDFWFLPKPEELMIFNFPEEYRWSITTKLYKIEDLATKPYYWPIFFANKLSFDCNDLPGTISVNNELKMTLKFPDYLQNRILFKTTLKFTNFEEKYKDELLRRYTHTDLEWNRNQCAISLRPPVSGQYYLLIQMKIITDDIELAQKESGSKYTNCVLFNLDCITDTSNTDISTYPKCKKDAYGPSTFYKCFNIKFYNLNPFIFTKSNNVTLKFQIYEPGTQIMLKLKSKSLKDNFTDNIQSSEVNELEFIFELDLPYKGEFGIEMSAFNSNISDEYFKLIWQYFVLYE